MKIKHFFPVALFALLCSACNNSPSENLTGSDTVAKEANAKQNNENAAIAADAKETKSKIDIKWNGNAEVAVAYLGGFASFGSLKADKRFNDYVAKFPVLAEFKSFSVDAQGYETFLIVPKDADAKVVVREYNIDMGLKKVPENSGKVYYESNSGDPILVKGNISDICPNLLVTITNENGKSVKFNPQLSMESGRLSRAEGMQDISPDAAFTVTGVPE